MLNPANQRSQATTCYILYQTWLTALTAGRIPLAQKDTDIAQRFPELGRAQAYIVCCSQQNSHCTLQIGGAYL